MTRHVAERRTGGPQVELTGWDRHTGIALEALDHLLRTHLRQTEGPGGLFEDVLNRAPHLMHEVERLRGEHLEIRAELDRAVRATMGAQLSAGTASVVDSIHGGRMAKHLDREDDLVWRAYDVDLGGGGR